MVRTHRIVAAVSIAGMLLSSSPAVVLAQATSTATSTAPAFSGRSSGGSGGSGLGVGLAIGAGVLGAGFLASQFVSRVTGISFGGRVLTVLPCSGGMIHITILPAGAFPISYIWTPATITFSAGPPRNPGQQVLGVADIPFVCFIGLGFLSTPIPLYGLRMQIVGTSPLI